jgi:hypothetical protein
MYHGEHVRLPEVNPVDCPDSRVCRTVLMILPLLPARPVCLPNALWPVSITGTFA